MRPAPPPGRVDAAHFDEIAAAQRARGATIGKGVRLLGHIDGVNPHLVSIGDYCVIGAQSALLTHDPVKGGLPVSVGSFCYLGYGALILPGVSLGDGCIVGAGAVVTRSVPAGSVVAGNPARVLRSVTEAEQAHIRETMLGGRLFGWTLP
jgi:acetyltransferase-like isoleucine patch superfamily enzyme